MINNQTKAAHSSIDMCWKLFLVMGACASVSLLPDLALAYNSSNSIQTVFCNLVGLLTGTTGKAVATVAIIAVGVGALLGKISWGMALIVALGVALIFGSATIVAALGGSASSCATGGADISPT